MRKKILSNLSLQSYQSWVPLVRLTLEPGLDPWKHIFAGALGSRRTRACVCDFPPRAASALIELVVFTLNHVRSNPAPNQGIGLSAKRLLGAGWEHNV